jgi:LDH2 family malate/lactate/ureidoglycolate dehydrogenase
LKKKAINPSPSIKSVKGSDKALELMDGDDGIGYILGRAGMERAIEKAGKYGVGMVVVDRSNHFGAAALYARMAAEKGMIGVATTNVRPNIGMKGNRKPSTGNNPIAMAAPLGGAFPFSLDISLSAVAGGKLLLASKKGEKIPLDWAVTSEGKETDDPDEGFKGFLLPVGMHKGFGLSLFVDIITGVLSGGAYLHELKSMYAHSAEPSLTSHLFCAIDPSVFMEEETFIARMRDWAAMIKNTPMVEEGGSQLIPGELEYLTEKRRMAEGLPFPPELVKDLDSLADEMGVGRLSGR